MTPEASLDLALHIVRTAEGVHGTLGTTSAERSRFEGWLGLTAAIARALETAGKPDDNATKEE
jgi:hypothetical protein